MPMTKFKEGSFMAKYSTFVYAALIAMVLAVYMFHTVDGHRREFDSMVSAAHSFSDGYDQQFIDMVESMESILAARAMFGYAGERDPMTGVTRMVVAPPPPPPRQPSIRRGTGQPRPAGDAAPAVQRDRVRLTAIIHDGATNRFTAVIMDGGRSLSVDVGDVVGDRRVTRITRTEVHMDSPRERFVYNIMGDNLRTPR